MVGLAALTAGASASAQSYNVTVYEASGVGQFSATPDAIANFTNKADYSTATFTYTGPLNFSNTTAQNTSNTGDLNSSFFGSNVSGITNYSGSSNGSTTAYNASGATYATLAGFLSSSGSVSGFGYGSLYVFTAAPGSYDGTKLTLTHDDGSSVYVNGMRLNGTTAGPTGATTQSVTLPVPTSQYTIYYGRENGTPSVLRVSATPAVPEPATWAMFIAGVGAIGGAMRSRRRRTTTAFA